MMNIQQLLKISTQTRQQTDRSHVFAMDGNNIFHLKYLQSIPDKKKAWSGYDILYKNSHIAEVQKRVHHTRGVFKVSETVFCIYY